jgi:phosphoadenylyl-sulfate reductase (thioredoxin)
MRFVDALRSEWKINLLVERPELYGIDFIRRHGENLYETDPDFCCQKNKVEPFSNLLKRYAGWITGVRRDQSSTRAAAEPIEILEGGKLKVQPLAHWTGVDVKTYITENRIPLHPLFSQGYTSIGCAPCTRPNSDPADERAGRWSGKAKTECGLHTYWKKKKEESGLEKRAREEETPRAETPFLEIPPSAPTNGTGSTGSIRETARQKPEEEAKRASAPGPAATKG